MTNPLEMVPTDVLLQEVSRRAHAMVLAISLPSKVPDPRIDGPQVDTTFYLSGAWFVVEGLAAKLHRQAIANAEKATVPPPPSIIPPLTFTIIPPPGTPP